MALRINPARLPVWRDPHTLQLGMGREAVTVTDIRAEEERLINLLFRGVANESLGIMERSIGIEHDRATALLTRLRPALLDSSPDENRASLSEEFVQQAFAEIIRASFEHNMDGQQVLARRRTHSVCIGVLDRVTLALALGLVAAGVGRVLCLDDSPVMFSDTGPLGFETSFVGQPKSAALQSLLTKRAGDTWGEASVGALSTARPTILIVAANHPLSESDLKDLRSSHQSLARDIAVLTIELGVENSRVSPILRPPATPCLDCRNLSMIDKDAQWASLASQLRSRRERLDDAQSALLCAGLALEKCLRFIDSPQHSAFDAQVVDHRSGMIFNESWSYRTDCGCR